MTVKEFLQSKVGGLLGWIIIICVIYFVQKSCSENFHKRIADNPAFADGYIYEVSYAAKHGWGALYNFQPNIDIIWGSKMNNDFSVIKNKIIYHHFPVIYNKDNPGDNVMLITPEDFNHSMFPSQTVCYGSKICYIKLNIENIIDVRMKTNR
jgi:hypothetical protein